MQHDRGAITISGDVPEIRAAAGMPLPQAGRLLCRIAVAAG